MSDDHATPSHPAPPGRRLLIVLDESPSGRHTAAIGAQLAATMSAEATFLIPIPVEHLEAASPGELAAATSAHQAECRDRVEPVFAAVRELARRAGVTCDTVLTVDEAPVDAVRRIATERQSVLIVVGSHGRGALKRMLRGSLVDELLQGSACPVLVCRDDMAFGSVAAMA